MFGPLTLIARDPIIAIVLVGAFLFGLVLHNVVQARLAARAGDRLAVNAGMGGVEPQAHLDLFAVLWYLLLGFGLVRPVPLRLVGRRAALVLAAGPLTLIGWAFVLLVTQRLLLLTVPAADVVSAGLRGAATAAVLHAVFYLVPFPTLDGGRILWEVGGREVRRVLGQLAAAGPIALYILWIGLSLAGVFTWVVRPIWAALQTLLGWLPL